MDRRSFVKRSCLGSAALFLDHFGTSPSYSEDLIPQAPPIHVNEPQSTSISPLRMPGLYPGRVIEIADERSIVANRVSQPTIRQMLDQAMRELAGEKSVRESWAKFVQPQDVVGIKINPSGAPACCSSPEIVREIVSAVQSVGVPARNIVVYDRYAYEMDIGSYQVLVPVGVVPTMKDHSASGVTGCLKNLGYGTFNNVHRSHRTPFSFTDPLIGVMCSVEPLRSKAVLHIMDGTRMVWHGGPLTQNQDFIHQAGVMLVGTDPVAMDTIELEKIEAKRSAEGAPSVWSRDPNSLTQDGMEFYQDAAKNLFYRQPHHIAAAGKLGLGISDLKQIDHRILRIRG